MKTLLLLVLIIVTAFSFAQDTLHTKLPISNREHKKQDIFIRQNIVGKWKDQNSTISFYPTGKFLTLFDDGVKDSGYWEIKKSKIILTMRPSYVEQAYKLLYFSKTSMQYQVTANKRQDDFIFLQDATIWIATKIEYFDK